MTVATHANAAETLRFSAPEGSVLNEFYRQGPISAHLVATSGHTPRLVVAFPSGNSGTAVWFDAKEATLSWDPAVPIESAQRKLPDGSVLRGITAELTATGGPIEVKQAIVSSVRIIREFEYTGSAPTEILTPAEVSKRKVVWERRRLDGAPGYSLSIEVLNGNIVGASDGEQPIEISASVDEPLHLRVTALTGDTPLTPILEHELLTTDASPDAHLRQILAFLTYEEKLLAGSWRFNTYFGRDTLMSLRLLAPVLQPNVMEAGLTSVLERLNDSGEVAHEEDIGELAVLRHIRAGLPPSDTPIYDYKMIDDDFMLAVVAAHYLLDTPAGRKRSAAFLKRRSLSGVTYGELLTRNLLFVVSITEQFAQKPDWRHLIALKPGEHVGNWRDSEDGLGGGHYPYDVNGVFVPAALRATGRLYASGALQTHLDENADDKLSNAAAMADDWLREAPLFFDVVLESSAAREAVRGHARTIGVDPAPGLAALGTDNVRFRAVALDDAGHPVPILNSDEAFALLFLDPAPSEVERIATVLTRPFPAGLMTDAGLLVANATYAPAELASRFGRSRYHGAVIWSWQQAMFAAGLARQLNRDDLNAPARAALAQARTRLRAAIDAAAAVRGSELWSWSFDNGRYHVKPFGQRDEDETESNAAQLWSTVHLARPRK